MGRRDDASGRVDPKRIGSDQFKPRTFGAGYLDVETLLPFLVITNQDTIVHTFTASIRQGNGPEFTVTFQIAAGSSVSWPTLGTAGIKVDQAGSPTSCKAFYSDIAPAGFKSAAGSGATTVRNNGVAGVAPSADATEQMAGLGAGVVFPNAIVLTPKLSGIVRFTCGLDMNLAAASTSIQIKMRYGTGAAPALNAVATGTDLWGAFMTFGGASSVVEHLSGSVSQVIGGLTLNTTYWFDLSVVASSHLNATPNVFAPSIEELTQ